MVAPLVYTYARRAHAVHSLRAGLYQPSLIARSFLIPSSITHSARPEAEMTSPTGGARRPRHDLIIGAGVAYFIAGGYDDVIRR